MNLTTMEITKENVLNVLNKEFELFEKNMLLLPAKEIFNQGYKIAFFNEVNYMLNENDLIDFFVENSNDYDWSNLSLEYLYERSFKRDLFNINDYEDYQYLFGSVLMK